MAKSKRKRVPKTFLKLPDLEQSKSAVLNSLTSASSKRSYDHAIREFIDWYCSEPRLAFDKSVVSVPYFTGGASLRLLDDKPEMRYAAWRMRPLIPVCLVPISPLGYVGSREPNGGECVSEIG